MIFVLGGIFPLALVPVLVLWLPDATVFGNPKKLSPPNATLLQRLDIASARRDAVEVAWENPISMLFGQGYALQTVLLWIAFFCSLLNLFLFAYWMPTVLNLIGVSPVQAVSVAGLGSLVRSLLFCILAWRSIALGRSAH